MVAIAEGWYCCDDDWSVWQRFETWTWAVLLIIQLSMVVFVVIHGRNEQSFREAFYVFFVAVTIVDCALALLRPSRERDETIFGTVYDMPVIQRPDPMQPDEPTIRATLNKIVVHAVVPALGHAQPLFLTAIAVNRFTAFAFPLKHASMWRTRTVVVTTISLAAIAAILGAASPVTFAISQAVKCSRATRQQRKELGCDLDAWAFQLLLVPTALITFTCAICCIISFVLNVGSIGMLASMRSTGRLPRKGPELQLFAHSLWMFLLQLFLAFSDAVFVADNLDFIVLELGLERLGLTWADFRHSSEWLAGVNATRTWVEGGLVEFKPGCTGLPGYWGDEALTPCKAWYLLLIGELRLREDPVFTVRMLGQCLFALSGAVFLLVISSNVRDAYFNFYFKLQCLRRKWAGLPASTSSRVQIGELRRPL